MAISSLLQLALVAATLVNAHGDHKQKTMQGPHPSLWYSNKLPGDGGTQADSVFSGITTFGRLPYMPCLGHKDVQYDIAFIGQYIITNVCSSCLLTTC